MNRNSETLRPCRNGWRGIDHGGSRSRRRAARLPRHTRSAGTTASGETCPSIRLGPHAAAEDDCVAGGRLFQLYCGSCHNARPLGERPFSNYQVAVAHMRDQAYLTGKEYRQIIHFLRRWDDVGPPTPAVRTLTETTRLLAADLRTAGCGGGADTGFDTAAAGDWPMAARPDRAPSDSPLPSSGPASDRLRCRRLDFPHQSSEDVNGPKRARPKAHACSTRRTAVDDDRALLCFRRRSNSCSS